MVEGDPQGPSHRRHTSPSAEPINLAGQIKRLKGFREAFPDITIEVEDIIAGKDRFAFRSTMHGTHLSQFLGIPPTRQDVTVGLIDVIRVEDGRFVEQWSGPDRFDLLQQLGAAVKAAN